MPDPSPTRSPPLRVLVIEDNPADAWLAEEALQDSGLDCDVEHRDSLAAARARHAEHPFDVILLDLGLPDALGATTVERARAFAPLIPLVVLTGSSSDRVLAESLGADADDFVSKSEVSPVSVERAVRHAIQRRRLTLRLREQQRELESTERRLQAVLGTVSDGIAVVDRDGRVLFANPALYGILGRTGGEVVEATIPGLSRDGTALVELPAGAGRGDEPRQIEVTTAPIVWDGTRARVASLRDVTERRHMEARLRAAQRMEAIGQLAGGLAHEINNLLAVVMANVGLLLDGPIDEEGRTLAREIERVARRGASLVRRLLAFGRKQRLRMRDLDLTATLDEIARTLRPVLPDDVALEVRASDAPCVVRADTEAVEQIVVNLVINARDALSGRGGRIGVELAPASVSPEFCRDHVGMRPGEYVRLSVVDDGSGMDADTLARAFEPFFSTKDPERGTGLGLAMVYGLAKQQEGFVYVRSEPGAGTTVDVFFVPAVGPSEPVAAEPAPVALHGGEETILLVEDEDDVRNAAARILRRVGYVVVEARDGLEALDLLRGSPSGIDLILSDVIMPNLGGRGLFEAVRRIPESPPVLFMSGYSMDDLRGGEELDGSFDLIAKPWTVPELLTGVRRALGGGAGSVAPVP